MPVAPVFYLGDSHVRYVQTAARHHLLAPRAVTGCEVGGATAVGMRNPNAMTNALGQFRNAVSNLDRTTILVIHLGEVDCGFVIWYRAAKYGETIQSQFQRSLQAYAAFIDELTGLGFSRLVITSATLPTITDTDQQSGVAIARRAVRAPQQHRTTLTHHYNTALQTIAASRNLPFANATPDMLDPSTGLTHQRLRNKDPLDHHMDNALAAAIWADHLNPCLDTHDPPGLAPHTWRATTPTLITGLASPPDEIPDDLKTPAQPGDTLQADLRGEASDHLTISQAALNGQTLPSRLRLLTRQHWTRA